MWRGGVGQFAIGADRRRDREKGVSVGRHDERQRLTGFIRRSGADRCGPVQYRLGAGILLNQLIWPLRKRRGIVHRVNCKTNRSDPRRVLAVIGLVGEGVRAVVVWRRSVCKRSIGRKGEAAVRWQAQDHGGQPVSFHVTVVGHDSWSGDREFRVLIDVVGVVRGHRRIIDRMDGDGDNDRDGIRRAVICLVGETVEPAVIERGQILKGAIRI